MLIKQLIPMKNLLALILLFTISFTSNAQENTEKHHHVRKGTALQNPPSISLISLNIIPRVLESWASQIVVHSVLLQRVAKVRLIR